MTLKVTPDQVRSKAGEIEKQRAVLENMMQQMKQQVNKLPAEFWKSRSGTEYGARYDSVQKNCSRALEVLMNHMRNLREAAQTYDRVEQTQLQAVGRLSTQDVMN